jgi:hypothetical protein
MRKISTFLMIALFAMISFSASATAVTGKTLYLLGGINGWSSNDSYKFTESTTTPGVYTLETSFKLYGAFKVADAGWSAETNWGASSSTSTLTVGTAFTLSLGASSQNITFATATDTCQVSKITLDTDAGTLLVEGTVIHAGNPTAETPIYLRGAFGGTTWPVLADYQFIKTTTDGVYEINKSFELTGAFKVATEDWTTVNFGSNGNAIVAGTEYTMTSGSNSNIAFANTTDTCEVTKVTFNKTAGTLLITGTMKGTTPVTPTEKAETIYLLGQINGNAMSPEQGVKVDSIGVKLYGDSITVADSGDGYGYIGVANAIGASATDWATVNASRWIPATNGTEIEIGGAAQKMQRGIDNSWKAAPGRYFCTINMADSTIALAGTKAPVVVSYPEKLYIMGYSGSWSPNDSTAILTPSAEGVYNNASVVFVAPTGAPAIEPAAETVYSYFSFTSKMGTSATDWDGIAASRYGAETDGTVVTNGVAANLVKGTNAFKVEAGTYSVKVSLVDNTVKLDKITGVAAVNAASARVIAGNGVINVIGSYNTINVYNAAGMLISRNQANVNCAPGMYLVQVNNKVSKVIVK